MKNSQDDIIVWGESIADLENTTKEILEAVHKNGLKLNKFLGHILTTDGIYPGPEKVKAISDMPIPANKSKLQTFLGMVAYLGKFIPHLSDASVPLCSLIVKNSIWDFTESHSYIYGQQFVIENDHKPLQSIFKRPINKTPPRLQRFMLYLQRYDFKIQFIPRKDFIVADAIRRSALPNTTPELTNAELESHIHLIKEYLPVSGRKLKEIQDETMKDSVLSKVCFFILIMAGQQLIHK